MLNNERFAGDPLLAKVASGQRNLSRGEQGPAVQAIQQALLDMGFGVRKWLGVSGREVGGVDGVFGAQTARAVERFQRSVGVVPSAQVCPRTLLALDATSPSPGRTAWEEGPRFFTPSPVLSLPGGESSIARVVVVLEECRTFLYDADGVLKGIFASSAGDGATPSWPGIKAVAAIYDQAVAESQGVRLWDDAGAFGSRIIDLCWWDPRSGKTYPSAETLHGTLQRRTVGMTHIVGGIRHYDEDIVQISQMLSIGDRVAVLETSRSRP